jgi:tetratricopeptide (TPR) repeat protein
MEKRSEKVMASKVVALVLVVLGLLAGMPQAARAEEFKLPSAEELATLPPEGVELYAAGIKALDHVDYERAYENLAKAAALQPRAVRLNLIVAALALKQGRSKKADEAREYYATAIRAYENILALPGLEPSLRRDVENRLKIAKEEQDTLAQRDAQREGRGNMFIKQLNRELAKATKTPKPAAAPSAPAVPSAGAVSGVLGAPPAALPALPAAYPGSMPAAPAMPGAAGAAPAAPGAMPALPGAPAAPGAMPALPGAGPTPAAPAGAPPTGPGGEVMI